MRTSNLYAIQNKTSVIFSYDILCNYVKLGMFKENIFQERFWVIIKQNTEDICSLL
jgi:hypothetical protein